MTKSIIEQTNETYEVIVKHLKEAGFQIMHPIIVFTSNVDKDAYISCNFSGTGIHIPLSEINFEDFRNFDKDIMRHYSTWEWIDKKKK